MRVTIISRVNLVKLIKILLLARLKHEAIDITKSNNKKAGCVNSRLHNNYQVNNHLFNTRNIFT